MLRRPSSIRILVALTLLVVPAAARSAPPEVTVETDHVRVHDYEMRLTASNYLPAAHVVLRRRVGTSFERHEYTIRHSRLRVARGGGSARLHVALGANGVVDLRFRPTARRAFADPYEGCGDHEAFHGRLARVSGTLRVPIGDGYFRTLTKVGRTAVLGHVSYPDPLPPKGCFDLFDIGATDSLETVSHSRNIWNLAVTRLDDPPRTVLEQVDIGRPWTWGTQDHHLEAVGAPSAFVMSRGFQDATVVGVGPFFSGTGRFTALSGSDIAPSGDLSAHFDSVGTVPAARSHFFGGGPDRDYNLPAHGPRDVVLTDGPDRFAPTPFDSGSTIDGRGANDSLGPEYPVSVIRLRLLGGTGDDVLRSPTSGMVDCGPGDDRVKLGEAARLPAVTLVGCETVVTRLAELRRSGTRFTAVIGANVGGQGQTCRGALVVRGLGPGRPLLASRRWTWPENAHSRAGAGVRRTLGLTGAGRRALAAHALVGFSLVTPATCRGAIPRAQIGESWIEAF